MGHGPAQSAKEAKKRSATQLASLAGLLAANLVLAGVIGLADLMGWIEFQSLFMDPNAIAEQPFYFGAYSNLGILVWCAGASIGLFTYVFVPHSAAVEHLMPSLLVGALYMTFACFDDLFLLHEEALPRLGISEKAAFLLHAFLLCLFVWQLRTVWRETCWLYLTTALSCFAGSVLLDREVISLFSLSAFPEDVLKFTGITMFSAYVLSLARDVLLRTVCNIRHN